MHIIVSPAQMDLADKNQIAKGSSARELMLNAALAIAKHIYEEEKILIVVGPGNNGGDGLALANILLENNKDIDILIASKVDKEAPLFYLNTLKEKNFHRILDFETFKNEEKKYNLVVDCLFGNGLDRVLQDKYIEIIKYLNLLQARKIAVDLPSGLNGLNGKKMGAAFKADLTIVLAAYKLGHFLQDAKDYTGKLVVEDINIEVKDFSAKLLDLEHIKGIFPKRKENTHKYNYGKVTIIAGSFKYQGAAILALEGLKSVQESSLLILSKSSLRVGAGLVNIAFPMSIYPAIAAHISDEILIPIEDDNGVIKFDENTINQIIAASDVILFGPGLSINDEVLKTLRHILKHFKGSIVIDADGINLYSKLLKEDLRTSAQIVLTPHLGEATVLFDKTKAEIEDNIVEVTQSFARENRVIILLKGPSTIVTNGEDVVISKYGSVAQAKAGNGDVLAGVLAGIEAYSKNLFQASLAATYIVAEAANKAKEEYGEYGVLASDLPKIIKMI